MPAVTVNIDEENLASLQEAAAGRHLSIEAFIEEMIREAAVRRRTIREAADYVLKKMKTCTADSRNDLPRTGRCTGVA
jgi:hypothetical protein